MIKATVVIFGAASYGCMAGIMADAYTGSFVFSVVYSFFTAYFVGTGLKALLGADSKE